MSARYLLLVAAACGGHPAAPPATPTPSSPTASAATEPVIPTMRLGHFTSRDHAVGLVFAKGDKSARVKFDGTQKELELDASQAPERTDYIQGGHRVVVQAFDDGRLVVFVEGREVEVFRDGDVDGSTGAVTPNPPTTAGCCNAAPVVNKDQPPDVKLKLGHYTNTRRGIGLVVDRTQHEAKVRFDGTKETLHLDPSPGGSDRTDYLKTAHQIVMQVWEDGRVVVYVPGANSPGIDVKRDADADPL